MRIAAVVLFSACAVEPPREAALDPGPIAACPIPSPDQIAGHEADFYRCAEEALGCGDDGYLIGYGARYAERFYRETRPRMSARGRQWIDDVLLCLQHELRAALDESTACDDVRAIAYDQHPACYTEAGFCTLPLLDLLRVVATIDPREWLSAAFHEQVVATAWRCLSE
jgi:hypothetical protein